MWCRHTLRKVANLECFREDDACSGQHGPAGVEQLVGAVLLHLCGVLAQTQGVVAVAAANKVC